MLAQAVNAAYQTVDDLLLHSLHGYFLRAGDSERPVLYEVERIRDGRSFTTRRVVAVQSGEAIFNMDVSFQIEEIGFEHADPVPNVPLPDELEDDVEVSRRINDDTIVHPWAGRIRPFETRSVFPLGSEQATQSRFFSPVWIRFPHKIDEVLIQHCLLAYASDMGMVSTGSLPHQDAVGRESLQMASLDHALWFHRDFRVDEWLLYTFDSPNASAARGFARGQLFNQTIGQGLR